VFAALLTACFLDQCGRFGERFFSFPGGKMKGAVNEYRHGSILRGK